MQAYIDGLETLGVLSRDAEHRMQMKSWTDMDNELASVDVLYVAGCSNLSRVLRAIVCQSLKAVLMRRARLFPHVLAIVQPLNMLVRYSADTSCSCQCR